MYARREKGGPHKSSFEVQKRFFFSPLSPFKGQPELESGLMGISTFLPNKEQGFQERNWATAVDQLTSLNPSFHPFSAGLGNGAAPLAC